MLVGDGKGDGPQDTLLGPACASWPDWCFFEALNTPTLSPQAGTWQKGEEERALTHYSCHWMKAKLIWGRPQATDVGGGPAKVVWRARE